VAFIGYLMAGFSHISALLRTAYNSSPVPTATPGHQAFVEGITAAPIKALSEAVVVLVTRSLVDILVRSHQSEPISYKTSLLSMSKAVDFAKFT
jgi:hypothetical protein